MSATRRTLRARERTFLTALDLAQAARSIGTSQPGNTNTAG